MNASSVARTKRKKISADCNKQYRDEYYESERNKQKEKEAAGLNYLTNTKSRLEKMKEYNKQLHERIVESRVS